MCLVSTGGRGEESSVIITLPECSAFSDIPEESLAKVLTYLTLIPRCVPPPSGFSFEAIRLPLPAMQCIRAVCILGTVGLWLNSGTLFLSLLTECGEYKSESQGYWLLLLMGNIHSVMIGQK